MEPMFNNDYEKREGGKDNDLKLENKQGNKDAASTNNNDDNNAHPENLVYYSLLSAKQPSGWLTFDLEKGTLGFFKQRQRTKKPPL